jgi:hypothetical protein
VVLLDVLYRAIHVDKGRIVTEDTHDMVCLRVPGAERFDHVSRDRVALLLPLLRGEYCLKFRQELRVDCFNEPSLNREWVFDVYGIVTLAGGRLVGGNLAGGVHSGGPKGGF